MKTTAFLLLTGALGALALPRSTYAQAGAEAKLSELERALAKLRAEFDAERAQREAREQELLGALAASNASAPAPASSRWYDRFTFGGYGEIHFNDVEGEEELIDNHRFVAYIGYRFADWIQMHSEVEFEHGLVGDGADGELALEQLHFDFSINEHFNVRAGRFLTPLGIINKSHEPTTFNGVERPTFDRIILPTTWSADGVGIFGALCDDVAYELYLQSSLDGSEFSADQGIRGGRQSNIAGLSQPAASGRLDWHVPMSGDQSLRLGVSSFAGGADNGNEGANPGIDADVQIYSADFQYSISRFDFRGAYAFEKIGGAADIGNNVASEIDGYMIEAACHVWPESWKDGKLVDSDAVVFVRYDDLDTQKDVPSGVSADPRGERDEITFGLGWFPVSNVVVKADYQIRDDDTDEGLPEQFNIGLGWRF